MMHQSGKPFAIRDENNVTHASTAKGGLAAAGRPGLGGVKCGGLIDSTPLKPSSSVIIATGTKSARKALGDLSSSQVNTRLSTPGAALLGQHGVTAIKTPAQFKECNSIKPAALSSSTAAMREMRFTDYDMDDMICSYVGKDKDPYDLVLRKTAKLKFTVAPTTCSSLFYAEETMWRDRPADAEADVFSTMTGSETPYEGEQPFLECELEL